jgi:hypothetical protein
VELEDICIHLFGIDQFEPAESYGSVIIQVPDPDEFYQSFAAGLRTAYGKAAGVGDPAHSEASQEARDIYGFTIVDPGGNWLRIGRLPPRPRPAPG